MWTQASLCQLASELDNSHKHVLGTRSLSVFLSLTPSFALVIISFWLSFSPDYEEDTFPMLSETFIRIID